MAITRSRCWTAQTSAVTTLGWSIRTFIIRDISRHRCNSIRSTLQQSSRCTTQPPRLFLKRRRSLKLRQSFRSPNKHRNHSRCCMQLTHILRRLLHRRPALSTTLMKHRARTLRALKPQVPATVLRYTRNFHSSFELNLLSTFIKN